MHWSAIAVTGRAKTSAASANQAFFMACLQRGWVTTPRLDGAAATRFGPDMILNVRSQAEGDVEDQPVIRAAEVGGEAARADWELAARAGNPAGAAEQRLVGP